MGKLAKIQRSRKHKKLKAVDPFYEGERKNQINPKDVNRCPRNVDEQEVPRSLQNLIRRQNMPLKQKKKHKKRNNFEKLERGMTRPVNPAPEFKQAPGERRGAFMRRIDSEIQYAIDRSKEQHDEYDKEQSKAEKKNSKKKEKQKEKRAAKIAKKREMREEKLKKDFHHLQDHVEFGEVAMQPPKLTAKPRKSDPLHNRPGKKSLLLNEIINSNLNQRHDRVTKREVGKTQKRKHLSMAKQQVMDLERSKVIDLYRKLKKQKNKTVDS